MAANNDPIEGADDPRPLIPPRARGESRPLWSVMIPTHNCAHYLRETLLSVLEQDPVSGGMQIEVVDDASTLDDPGAVVAELGAGRVDFFRQPINVGHVRNFNTCLLRARGELVHILHGDDRVGTGFYAALGPPLMRHPDIGAAFSRVAVMDGDGQQIHLKPMAQPERGVLGRPIRVVAVDQPIQTPCMVVRRAVYEVLGGFDPRFKRCGEDLEMWIRIASRFPIWYEPETLAFYRYQESSLSGQAARTGQNIRETCLAIRVSRHMFPPQQAAALESAARQRVALWGVGNARIMLRQRDYEGARKQLVEAIRCSRSARVILGAIKTIVRAMPRSVRRASGRPPHAGG
jgi:GT2 family glycosyltransferase